MSPGRTTCALVGTGVECHGGMDRRRSERTQISRSAEVVYARSVIEVEIVDLSVLGACIRGVESADRGELVSAV